MPRYQVIFDGTAVPDDSVDQVKQRLCRLFNKDRTAINKLFAGRPVIIKKNIDQLTARKLKNAMKQSGAACRIEIVSGTQDNIEGAEPTAPKKKTRHPPLITPAKCPALLQYAPLTCPEISPWDNGINLNRKDRQEIPFTAIRMASVFKDNTDTAHPFKFMFYLHDMTRPLMANAETIRFKDFPGGSGTSLVESLRLFLKLLTNRHPDLILDVETHNFLQKGHPQLVTRGADAFAASLGKALETRMPLTTVRHDESGDATSTAIQATGTDGTRQQTTRNYRTAPRAPVTIKHQEPELTPEQRKALRSRHRRKAVIFLILSIFFGLGFIGTTADLYQGLNKSDSQSSFYGNITLHSPAVQRQQELLDYNRKMSKVTSWLSLVVCFVLTLFFFSRSLHHFGQTRE